MNLSTRAHKRNATTKEHIDEEPTSDEVTPSHNDGAREHQKRQRCYRVEWQDFVVHGASETSSERECVRTFPFCQQHLTRHIFSCLSALMIMSHTTLAQGVSARHTIHVSCACVFDLSLDPLFAPLHCLSHLLLHPPDLFFRIFFHTVTFRVSVCLVCSKVTEVFHCFSAPLF